MTVPVLHSFLEQYPEHEVWFVSRRFAAGLVKPVAGIRFFEADLKGRHKGISGMVKLFNDLRRYGPFDSVIDLHRVLRTHVLSLLFRLNGNVVSRIDKGRGEKKKLCRKNNKVFHQLPSTFERYRQTFKSAGFAFELSPFPGTVIYGNSKELETSMLEKLPRLINILDEKGIRKPIGVAPFAKHHWKMWPTEKMKELLKILEAEGYSIVLFGGRGEEQQELSQWGSELKNTISVAGQLTFSEELYLISKIGTMLSMDSANMHLASLAGARVVSIWGATHPYAGFYGYGQSNSDAVQIDLECRPCSVYGNKECHRGDFACMHGISPEMVFSKIKS
ncbi:MAG: glycosyltransferase family 9 protein [Prolixibacteraceae bacterium]|nr:glycosyltransferase family 9 protein [Prolixibacteraceae bacterium]